jgi:hypothetical protein
VQLIELSSRLTPSEKTCGRCCREHCVTIVEFIDENGLLPPSHWNLLAAFAQRKALAQLPRPEAEKHHCDRLAKA